MSDAVEIRFVGISLPVAKTPIRSLYSTDVTPSQRSSRLSSTWTAVKSVVSPMKDTAIPVHSSAAFRSRTINSARNNRGKVTVPITSAIASEKQRKFLLTGRKTGVGRFTLLAEDTKQETQDCSPTVNNCPFDSKETRSDASSSSSLDYSFLEAAKKRAIEQDSCSSSSSIDSFPAVPQYTSARSKGTILLFSAGEKRKFVRFASSLDTDWKYERAEKVRITAKIAKKCMWISGCLEQNGVIVARVRCPTVRITLQFQMKWVADGTVYNHFPGCSGIYREERVISALQTQWRDEIAPIAFNSSQELFSFSRYCASHPKSLWVQRDVQGKSRQKLVSAAQGTAEKGGFLLVKYTPNPHLIDGKKYSVGVYAMVTSFNPLVLYIAQDNFLLFLAQEPFSLHPDQYNNASIHFPGQEKRPNLRPFSDFQQYFPAFHQSTGDVQSQIRDLTVKSMLVTEKLIVNPQQKYSFSALQSCFEVIQLRFTVDSRLKVKLDSLKPAKWSTKRRLERLYLKNLLCGALNIVGVAAEKCFPRPQNDDFLRVFADESSRYAQFPPFPWERIFPLANSLSQYRQFLQFSSDRTKSLCKFVHSHPYS